MLYVETCLLSFLPIKMTLSVATIQQNRYNFFDIAKTITVKHIVIYYLNHFVIVMETEYLSQIILKDNI